LEKKIKVLVGNSCYPSLLVAPLIVAKWSFLTEFTEIPSYNYREMRVKNINTGSIIRIMTMTRTLGAKKRQLYPRGRMHFLPNATVNY